MEIEKIVYLFVYDWVKKLALLILSKLLMKYT